MNSAQLLKQARKEGRCIAAFNIYNLETMQAAFIAAKNVDVPLILAFGEGYLNHTSVDVIVAMAKVLDKDHGLPVVLHLDHAKNIDTINAAIDAGFTSVMYDGSHLSLEDNIKNTQYVVNLAHNVGVSVEGELGYMNPEDGSESGEWDKDHLYTDAGQAQLYVSETCVDSLAVAVGNAHGLYKGTPRLDLERLEEIYYKINIPIVLHGCSGIPQNLIVKAISKGVAKINVNTEIALTGGKIIKEMFVRSGYTDIRLEKLMEKAQQEMTRTMEWFLKLTYDK